MRISMNVRRFKEELRATADQLHAATRPAAQEGAEIIYRQARLYCPVFEDDGNGAGSGTHKFYGSHGVYGPYKSGNLRDSIYQVFSKDKSFRDVSTYHVSWNATKAPYGWMVELGTSKAAAQSFLGRAIIETKEDVKAAVKGRFIEELRK